MWLNVRTLIAHLYTMARLTNVLTELDFFANVCGIVHGDISINNIIIVRLLLGILAADSNNESLPSQGTSNSDIEGGTSPPAATAATTAGIDMLNKSESEWSEDPCTLEDGFPYPLPSGGAVIDFDYSREVNTPSLMTSVRNFFIQNSNDIC